LTNLKVPFSLVIVFVIELESHQRTLEEKLQKEEDLAVMAQAEQYQASLRKLVEGYKAIEQLLLNIL